MPHHVDTHLCASTRAQRQLQLAGAVAGPFWRQDRKILSPHGSRPNSKNRGERLDRKTAIIAICFGLLGPFQTVIACLEIKQKQPRDRKTISRHYWRFFLKPQPPHTRQKNEQKYGPQTAEFALFHTLSRFCSYFCPVCGGNVFLNYRFLSQRSCRLSRDRRQLRRQQEGLQSEQVKGNQDSVQNGMLLALSLKTFSALIN